MKIALLQLSDFHYESNKYNIGALFSNVKNLLLKCTVDKIYVLICGDIINCGKIEGYAKFNETILKLTCDPKFNNKIKCFCVPGNHDIVYNGKNSFQDTDISSLNEYFNATKQFISLTAIKPNFLDSSDNGISVSLINSCYGSNKKSNNHDDKGKHYITDETKIFLQNQNPQRINILLMHHGIEWFDDKSKNVLQNYILKKTTCVLVGHDHYGETEIIKTQDSNNGMLIIKGKAVNDDTIEKKGFILSVIDLEAEKIFIQDYDIDENYNLICGKINYDKEINVHCDLKCKLKESFEHCLKYDANDMKYEDYYVFQGLYVQNENIDDNKDIDTFSKLLTIFNKNDRITIMGGRKSGKTLLAKKIFIFYYDNGYQPIYLDVDNYRGSIKRNIVEKLLEEQYEESKIIVDADRILIIDNVDKFEKKEIEKFLNDVNNNYKFKKIILLYQGEINYDLTKLILEISEGKKVLELQIKRFKYSVRKDLINKVFDIKKYNCENRDKEVDLINNIFSNNILRFAVTPHFIIKYINEYVKNNSQMELFTHYDLIYISDLVERLKAVYNSDYDDTAIKIQMSILSEIAYFMHTNKKPYINLSELSNIISSFCDEYQQYNIETIKFVSNMKEAYILKQFDNDSYGFMDKIDLAYFISSKIKKISNQSEYNIVIEKLLNNICFDINIDILLFLILVKADNNLADLIVKKATIHFDEMIEYDINSLEIDEINIPVKETLPDKKELIKKDKLIDEAENKKVLNEYKIKDIYKYSDDDYKKEENKIICSYKFIEILSKIISSFILDLSPQTSNQIINLLYVTPNKTINSFIEPLNKIVNNILQEKYDENKAMVEPHLKNSIIKKVRLFIIFNVYILYSYIAQLVVNKSTIKSLTNCKNIKTDNNRFQQLLFYLHSGDFDNFSKLAKKLKNNDVLNKSKILMLAVREFFVVNNYNLNPTAESFYSEFCSLNKNTKKELLINKYIVKNKK